MTAIPCRKCGVVGGDVTLFWKPDRLGRLEPYAAQCRNPCGLQPRPAPRRREAPRTSAPPGPAVVSASRPGTCAVCPRDIAPGDRITSLNGSGYMHVECAPGGTRLDEGDAPERAERRTRTRHR